MISTCKLWSHKIYNVTHLCKYASTVLKTTKQMAVWWWRSGALLHPPLFILCQCVCVCACVLDRHLTHRLPLFSLGWLVFGVSHAGWELCGTTRVLLYCLPSGHVSLCVCMCFCASVWGKTKMTWLLLYNNRKKNKTNLNQRNKKEIREKNWENDVGSV